MSKIVSVEFAGEQDTYDLEVDHPDHQYYLANGVLTSNSHSISYSHISFYTAWLRCHYPVQFMCALINSEDPNSPATQKYLTECSNMGIKVLPPSINATGKYAVTGPGQITTGLSAMKGIGDTAIVDISRNAPYESLAMFFAKTSVRVVNKRVMQSLAKAGAFDKYRVPRKVMHDTHEKMRTKVKTHLNKHRKIWMKEYLEKNPGVETDKLEALADKYISGNLESLIRMMKSLYETEQFTEEDEWSKRDLLIREQEVLGRTISGSLHEVFSGFFRGNSMSTPFSKIESLRPKTRVRVEAIVKSKVKEFKIKNGNNVGQKFAKYIIEDTFGATTTMTVWADDYAKYKPILTDGTPIKAICTVNEYMGQKDLAMSTLEKAYGKDT